MLRGYCGVPRLVTCFARVEVPVLTVLVDVALFLLQAVEILWTPEDENDTLTTRDMLQDYPLLRPL